jgi:hypothetical protein
MIDQQDGADYRGDDRRDDHHEPESALQRGARGRGWRRHSSIMYRAAQGFHSASLVRGN